MLVHRVVAIFLDGRRRVVAVSRGSLEDVHCKTNTEPYSMDDGLSLCVVQAAWLSFFDRNVEKGMVSLFHATDFARNHPL